MYVQIGSSVIICYVRVRETLAAANRLQRYNKKLKYTKEFMFFVDFFYFCACKLHTFGMYCLTLRELLQIFLDAFHADNILAFEETGVVIDNGFVYCFSFYIEDSITSKKIRCRF